jgi:hypothetical protein
MGMKNSEGMSATQLPKTTTARCVTQSGPLIRKRTGVFDQRARGTPRSISDRAMMIEDILQI